MRKTSNHCETAQPFNGTGSFTDLVGFRIGLFLLLVITLLLTPVVYANSPTDTKNTTPIYTLEKADNAPVVVNGKVLFQVVGVSAYPSKRRKGFLGSELRFSGFQSSQDLTEVVGVHF